MEINKAVDLKNFITMKTGGAARLFSRAKNLEEIQESIQFAEKEHLPWYVLGGGSNILAGSLGFAGLIIRNELDGISFAKDGDTVLVSAGAGVVWDTLVVETMKRGLYGLENLSLIPGTVGAAPMQNIGAYGAEVKDTIETVETFDTKTKQIRIFSNAECQFSYRDSFFKKEGGKRYIVTKVTFRLNPQGSVSIRYKDLENYFAAHRDIEPTLESVRQAVIEIRTNKLPSLIEYGTAGSFFKNPIVESKIAAKLKKEYPELPMYPDSGAQVKVSAGYLIDKVAGLKAYREGDAGVYEKQALVLVNHGTATGEQILELAEKIIAVVKEKTGIVLQLEVQTLGFK